MKRMLLLVILSMLLLSDIIYAQSLDWATDGGGKEIDSGVKVAMDSDGHLITGLLFSDTLTLDGEIFISMGGFDVLIVKYNDQGEVIWAKQLSGSSDIYLLSLTVDKDNNIYILGSLRADADLDPGSGELMINSAGPRNTFFAKYTTDGNIVWGYLFESTGFDFAYSIVVSETSVYVGAASENEIDFDFSASEYIVRPAKTYIAKYTLDAELIWVITYEADSPGALALDSEENIYVTGVISQIADLDPNPSTTTLVGHNGGRDIYLAKYDSSGSFIWGHSTGDDNNDVPIGIALDSKVNIAITGEFAKTVDFDFGPGVSEMVSSGFACFVAVYDSSGAFIWVDRVDKDGDTGYEHGVDVTFDMDDNLFLTTISSSEELVFSNSNGTIVSPNPFNEWRAVIVKFNNTNYTFNFVFDLAADGRVTVNDILTDEENSLYLVGSYPSTLNFDPNGDTSLTSRGLSDFFLAKYNSTYAGPEVPLRSAGIVFTVLLIFGAIIIRRVH